MALKKQREKKIRVEIESGKLTVSLGWLHHMLPTGWSLWSEDFQILCVLWG
jgi:hypothetical protein